MSMSGTGLAFPSGDSETNRCSYAEARAQHKAHKLTALGLNYHLQLSSGCDSLTFIPARNPLPHKSISPFCRHCNPLMNGEQVVIQSLKGTFTAHY